MGERLGVLGGTFDPPHVGHAIVALDVREGLRLDRLLLVPAGQPPHRDAVLPPRARFELTRRLFAGVEGIEVSDIELSRPGPSYTVDTLAQLGDAWRPEALFCVIGADQLEAIETWHEYRRLPELARVAVMRRAGQRPPPEDAGIPYIPVEVTRIDVSSTLIRERLRRGRSIRFLVPDSVEARVEEAWRAHAPAARNASLQRESE